MTASDYLLILGLGAMVGAAGQMARAIVGISKSRASADETVRKFDASRLVVSLLIGATAGMIAALFTIDNAGELPRERLLTLLASGYAGADFIEGAMQKVAKPA